MGFHPTRSCAQSASQQKCTWHMLHRIRLAMADLGSEKLGANGPVETDESFVGGKVKNMHRSRRVKGLNYSAGNGKAIVMGMLERGGKVRARVIKDRKLESMKPILEAKRCIQVHTSSRTNIATIPSSPERTTTFMKSSTTSKATFAVTSIRTASKISGPVLNVVWAERTSALSHTTLTPTSKNRFSGSIFARKNTPTLADSRPCYGMS